MVMATAAFAGKTYQCTGKVIEVKDNVIVADKNGEKFEMSKDANTKVKGDLKVGAKVTVKYESRAAEIEVKGKQGTPHENQKRPGNRSRAAFCMQRVFFLATIVPSHRDTALP